MDVAFVAEDLAATLSITNSGLPDYCLTIVDKCNLTYTGTAKTFLSIDEKVGLIYRGTPGTVLAASETHERMSVWIPHLSLTQRLAALLDAPVSSDVEFQPAINWSAPMSQALRHLVGLMVSELRAPVPSILGSKAASRFTNLYKTAFRETPGEALRRRRRCSGRTAAILMLIEPQVGFAIFAALERVTGSVGTMPAAQLEEYP